jgi:predicted nucleic-acid-binding protein
MKSFFLDTNYFLRFLIKDNQSQYLKAKKILHQANQGKTQVFSSIIVFFEINWVLNSFYQQKKKEIISVLDKILQLPAVKFENHNLLTKSLEIFRQSSLELEDCYNFVYSQKFKKLEFLTFDQKLKKFIRHRKKYFEF